jgi:hypothetical protein
VLAAPKRSEGGPDANPIKSLFHRIEPTEWSDIDGQLIRARKRELTSQTSTQKKFKKSLATRKTPDKRGRENQPRRGPKKTEKKSCHAKDD